jgi:hypothetical protein
MTRSMSTPVIVVGHGMNPKMARRLKTPQRAQISAPVGWQGRSGAGGIEATKRGVGGQSIG